MGWFFKSIKGIVDRRASGESIIELQLRNYLEFSKKNPEAEPHTILSHVHARRMAVHGNNPQNEAAQVQSLSETFAFACLPFPKNVRASSIAFINLERPDILQHCPDILAEYRHLMLPVREARKRGEFQDLYQRYNPTLAVALKQTIESYGEERASFLLNQEWESIL
jgi:hypothetical protein